MSINRRNHSSLFKARVAIDAICENETVAELSTKHQIHSNMIISWKKQLIDESFIVFDSHKRGRQRRDEPKPDDLYMEIGRLKVELEWLKKKSGVLS